MSSGSRWIWKRHFPQSLRMGREGEVIPRGKAHNSKSAVISHSSPCPEGQTDQVDLQDRNFLLKDNPSQPSHTQARTHTRTCVHTHMWHTYCITQQCLRWLW